MSLHCSIPSFLSWVSFKPLDRAEGVSWFYAQSCAHGICHKQRPCCYAASNSLKAYVRVAGAAWLKGCAVFSIKHIAKGVFLSAETDNVFVSDTILPIIGDGFVVFGGVLCCGHTIASKREGLC